MYCNRGACVRRGREKGAIRSGIYTERVRVFSLARAADPRANLAFRLAVYAYVTFGILDCVTTGIGLAVGGREGNPLAASIYQHYGLASLFAFKAIVMAFIIVVLTLLPRRVAAWTTIAFTLGVAVGVVGNLQVIRVLG
jgi:hypothetical protein